MLRKLTVILLSVVICLLGATIVLAQVQYNSLEEYEEATGEKIEKFSEAPMLRVEVAAGELPSVEKRLPEEPIVIEPLEEIGQYGGTLRFATITTNMGGDGLSVTGEEGILTLAPDYSTIIPNICTDWELSKDGKSLTLYLRKGIKWSDGVPCTTDDILFWYEDIILNDELTPAKPAWLSVDKLAKLEKIDDYTIRFVYTAPQPLLVRYLAMRQGRLLSGAFSPAKHYMKQFHPRYTPIEELEKMAKEKGFDFWYQLFSERGEQASGVPVNNPDCPVLGTYKLEERGIDSWRLERNPYYWKVDTAGNQLPYIDGVFVTKVANPEMLNAKIVTGENDFAIQHTSTADYTLYKEMEEEGGYRVLVYLLPEGAKTQYFFNQTCQDPVSRKIYRDVRFRRAMSLAMDREEINEAAFMGMATPRQSTVIPSCSFYEPEFAQAYAQYDLEEANRLLDEMGLEWDKNGEYRLRPDGKRLGVIFGHIDFSADYLAINELVREHWKKVGFDLVLKPQDWPILHERMAANELELSQMSQIGSDAGFTHSDFTCYVPFARGWISEFGPLWTDWYVSKGEKGEEPIEEVKKNLERWEKMRDTMDDEERIRLGKELLRSQAENLWVIGTIGMPPRLCVVKNNLRNLPEKASWGKVVRNLIPHHPETWFFKQK